MTDDTTELPRDRTQQLPRTVAVRQTKRIVVGVIGGIILGAGAVMLVTPGPGLLVVILGLTILSWEFPWAKRFLHRARAKLREVRRRKRRT